MCGSGDYVAHSPGCVITGCGFLLDCLNDLLSLLSVLCQTWLRFRCGNGRVPWLRGVIFLLGAF